jgi:hypothetical protein
LDGPKVVRAEEDGSETPLSLPLGSGPDGAEFEWGIDSPGADQLALALLIDAYGEAEAEACHVDFKFDVVADLDTEWFFTAGDVADWLDDYLDER